MTEFWTDEERDRLDYVVIRATVNGSNTRTVSPGLAVITGPDGRQLDWQVQRGPGLSGYRQAFWGLGLAEFELELTMWTADDRAQYELWKTVVKPSRPGLPQKIYRIEHPLLNLLEVDHCVFLSDPMLVPDGNVGWTKIKYKCREWRKPLPTIAVPAEATNNAEKTFNDAQSASIEAEAAAWKDLASGFQTNPS